MADVPHKCIKDVCNCSYGEFLNEEMFCHCQHFVSVSKASDTGKALARSFFFFKLGKGRLVSKTFIAAITCDKKELVFADSRQYEMQL